MRGRLVYVSSCFFIFGACAHFNSAQRESLNDASRLSDRVIRDTLFLSIVMDLESSVAWDKPRRENLPLEGRAEPMKWVLAQFARRGTFADSAVRPWRKWYNPWSATIATTAAGHDTTRVNLNSFNLNPFALTNTLVHERTHSFCVLHPFSQNEADNYCDPGYVIGDLAEAVARYRSTGSAATVDTVTLCPALCRALTERGLSPRCRGGTSTIVGEPWKGPTSQ
jgi:hypothetical protein